MARKFSELRQKMSCKRQYDNRIGIINMLAKFENCQKPGHKIFIAHRGNLSGPAKDKENHPDHIINAITYGQENDFNIDVEIDVWVKNSRIILGHDEPQYEVTEEFLVDNLTFLWCHAKNMPALKYLIMSGFNCFWHQEDDAVLTSRGIIWTYPGKELTSISIAVMPETVPEWNIDNALGVCSDNLLQYLKE